MRAESSGDFIKNTSEPAAPGYHITPRDLEIAGRHSSCAGVAIELPRMCNGLLTCAWLWWRPGRRMER